MKNFFSFVCILCLTLSFGCSVAGGIFKAGVWIGVIVVVCIVGTTIFLVSRASNKS